MSRRIALVTEIISPYRIPVFNALNDLLGGALHVFFISETERRRSWPVHSEEIEFSFEVLGGPHFQVPYRGDSQPVYLTRPLFPRLRRGAFDAVIVGGWNHLPCFESLAWSAVSDRKFVLWSETPLLGALPTRPARTVLKRAVVRGADGFVVPGPTAGQYLLAFGADPRLVFTAPNAVDNGFWSETPAVRTARERLTLLFVGRLVELKGVDLALRAFATSRLAGQADFLVAGDGPERLALERLAVDGVRFVGEQNREELRQLYHSVDMLVLPSLFDSWGLVLNEAACAGVAAIASDGAGGCRDMIKDGANGLVVERGSVEALRAAFDRLADDPDLPRRMGAAAAEAISAFTPEACARGLLASVS